MAGGDVLYLHESHSYGYTKSWGMGGRDVLTALTEVEFNE